MSSIRVRNLGGLKVLSATPAASDIALINQGFAAVVQDADSIHVREAKVAHDKHDRTYEAFPREVLDRFAETLPGKSMIMGHDTRTAPLGKWFRADVRGRTETMPIIDRAKKDAEIVPGMVEKNVRVSWLEAAVYFINDPATDQLRKNIDAGVYDHVSIGFSFSDLICDACKTSYLRSSCPHILGMRDEKGQLVTGTYSTDDLDAYEARETSIVYLGAQQHAEFMKSVRDGTLDPQRSATTSLGVDYVALKEFEALARKHGHQQKSWHFAALGEKAATPPPAAEETNEMDLLKRLQKALGLTDTATEDEAIAAADAAHKTAGEAETAKKSLVDAETAKTADAAKIAELEPAAKIGTQAMADLAKEYVDHCFALKQSETEAKAVAELFVSKGDYEGLKKLVGEKQAEKFKTYPAGKSGEAEVEEQEEKPKRRPSEFQLG